jgi:6-phosphogluconolactonase
MTKNAGRLLIFENQGAMADYMLKKWTEIHQESIDRKGRFVAALSGGQTPAKFYRKLAGQGINLQWDKTFLFMVDERFVPPFNQDSNYRMIADTLLRNVDIPTENVYPIPTKESDPLFAALNYEREMIRFFGIGRDEFPEYDLIMLGLGEDGHTASLFPGTEAVKERQHLMRSVAAVGVKCERITMTLPVINRARNVIFLVSGRKKATVLREIIEKKNSCFPAAQVKPELGSLLFVVDAEAAELLRAPITQIGFPVYAM